ncbi:unnamed protein product [Adineta ricciae]|uniref:Transposase-like protein n=1 Tax=Adineta ricciae TaxID=249248 RepID=A0A815TR02_ADIRI|nr:unnamed protein product [Adineta ricciae]CAF1510011.1 unnamed protein product [Adineta ricciae]
MIEYGREVLMTLKKTKGIAKWSRINHELEFFIMFTCKRLLRVIKDKGESWASQYFRDNILIQNVFPFLKDQANVIEPDEVIFVHDKAPCMRANKTQHLLQDNGVNFWSNDIWLDNSPDLNAAEHIGSIIKDEVEKKMSLETGYNRYHEGILQMHIANVLTGMEEDTELFENLLCSYPSQVRAEKKTLTAVIWIINCIT